MYIYILKTLNFDRLLLHNMLFVITMVATINRLNFIDISTIVQPLYLNLTFIVM